jgi:hypothetical protein
MGVKDTSFNEEVTKHSVHTLVFRSLKRTHDMFVSDQVLFSVPTVLDYSNMIHTGT